MYNPPAFRQDDVAVLHDAIRNTGLSTVITAGQDGIQASHLPLMLDAEDGPHGTLLGHFARANPQWRSMSLGSPALVVMMGPDAYISPSNYASKAEHGRVVPTWNYVAIHATCTARIVEDAAELRALVSRLTDLHEAGRPKAWAVSDAPEDFIQSQLKGIVGVVLTITALEGKWKMSQNRQPADRQGVIENLGASDNPILRDVAALVPR